MLGLILIVVLISIAAKKLKKVENNEIKQVGL